MTAELKLLCPACGAVLLELVDDEFCSCDYCGNHYHVQRNGDEIAFHLSSMDAFGWTHETATSSDLAVNTLADEIDDLYAQRKEFEEMYVGPAGRMSGSIFFLGILVLGISLIYNNLPGEIIGAGLLIYSLIAYIREEKKKRALQESIAELDEQIFKMKKNITGTSQNINE
mgnify:CR=1 FL=1